MINALVPEFPPIATKLAEKFWAGSLTIIFRGKPDVHQLLTGGAGKVGVRIPDNDFCRVLLEQTGLPIVSTSANISGTEGPQDIARLRLLFADQVDLVVDGGVPASNMPSTVVDVSDGALRIVREGAVPLESVRQAANLKGSAS